MGFSVLPKATQFFDMFARAGANAVEAARLVEQRFVDPSVVKHSQVKALEHVGDNMTGEIITLLHTLYVTPFDREDIYGLASATDDVLDHMDYASELLDVYRLAETTDFARQQCAVMVNAAGHLAAALGSLRGPAQAESHLLEVKTSEDEGDRLVKEAIGSLFADPQPRSALRDPLEGRLRRARRRDRRV